MARKKNTKKRRSGLLGALVLLILLGVMAYKLVEVYGDLSAAKEQEARLRTQVEQKEEENNSLKDALSHADDPDYIANSSYFYWKVGRVGQDATFVLLEIDACALARTQPIMRVLEHHEFAVSAVPPEFINFA